MLRTMKPTLIVTFLLLLAGACSGDRHSGSFSDRLFDDGWLFFRGDIERGEAPGLDESSWRRVNLPHDWSIEDIPGTRSPFDSDRCKRSGQRIYPGRDRLVQETFPAATGRAGKEDHDPV